MRLKCDGINKLLDRHFQIIYTLCIDGSKAVDIVGAFPFLMGRIAYFNCAISNQNENVEYLTWAGLNVSIVPVCSLYFLDLQHGTSDPEHLTPI